MEEIEEIKRDQRNAYYYNQMLKKAKKKGAKKKSGTKAQSFSSQTINFKDYLYVPEGMEFIVYSLYFMLIPYTAGLVFLFFAIAGADFNNFMLLDLNKILIVWAIGYEVVATISLTWIFILFIKYDAED